MITTLPYDKLRIRPIKNEADYDETLCQIEKIFDAVPGTPEFDLLEVLTVLVEKYESVHYPISLPDPIEAIKISMIDEGMNQTDLGKLVGGRANASLILNRKRKLSINIIRDLSIKLKIPVEILIQDYSLITD